MSERDTSPITPQDTSRPTRTRRTSFEGVKKADMRLGDLPGPSFATLAAGLRSVPAKEKSIFGVNGLPVDDGDAHGGSRTPGGSLTPGAGGALGLGATPWNLFSGEGDPSFLPGAENTAPRQSSPEHAALGYISPLQSAGTWAAPARTKSTSWNEERSGPISHVGKRPNLTSVGEGTEGAKVRSFRSSLIRTLSFFIQTSAPSPLVRSTSYSGSSSLARAARAAEKPSSGLPSLRRADSQREPLDETDNDSTPTTCVHDTTSRISGLPADSSLSSADQASSVDNSPELNPSRFGARNSADDVHDITGTFQSLGLASGLPMPHSTNLAYQQQMPRQPSQTNLASLYSPAFPSSRVPSTQGTHPFSDYGSTYSPYRRDSGYAAGPASPPEIYGMPAGYINGDRRPSAVWNANEYDTRGYPDSRFVNANSNYTSAASYARGMPSSGYSTRQSPYPVNGYYAQPQLQQQPYYSQPTAGPRYSQNAYMQDPISQINYHNQGFAEPYGQGQSMRYDDRPRAVKAPILEEFRANRHRQWGLADLAGNIVLFSSDQLGSRHLQTKLETASPEEKRMYAYQQVQCRFDVELKRFADSLTRCCRACWRFPSIFLVTT